MEVKFFEPEVFISEIEIQNKVLEIAKKINAEYGTNEITAICTLKGSVLFYNDVLKKLNMPVNCEFFGVSTYGNQMVSTGQVKVTLDLSEPLEGKHVIVFEDIVDSGLTLQYLLDHLKVRKPASLRTAVLLYKPEALKVPQPKIDYVGFQIQNEFVVGYGLDYAEKFRGLPYIGILKSGNP
jgi:hypoxanthine phosphoribosyltransferase